MPVPVTAVPLLRFIPFRRADIVHMCEEECSLDPAGGAQLRRAKDLIEGHFGAEFHQLRERLKNAYAPLDPDADTRTVDCLSQPGVEVEDLAPLVEVLLDRANYEQVTGADLQRAFESRSLFPIRLSVDLDEFEEVLLYFRGATPQEEEVRSLFGLVRKTVNFTLLERVVLYIRFKSDIDVESTLGGCRPASTMLKLFQNVPDADIEMLFPNTRVGMRGIDKLMIAVPAVVSGTVTLTTKIGATLVLFGTLLGFWLGLHSQPVDLDRTTVLALLAGFGSLGAYFWKQFSAFRNRQLKYTQTLTENLYFKLLDNNAGVLYRILDDAEESECKESLLAYCALLQADRPLSRAEVDAHIETWMRERWQCRLDFEVDDALAKLQSLQLAVCEEGNWRALDPG